LEEATLHALFELIERDAVASLRRGRVARPESAVPRASPGVDPRRDTPGPHRTLSPAWGVRIVLLWVPSRVDVHTFWCALVDERPFAGASMVRFGRATHLSPEYGALRAVLEAAQGRLSAIHGAREDVDARSYEEAPSTGRSPPTFSLSRRTPYGRTSPLAATRLRVRASSFSSRRCVVRGSTGSTAST